jgi:putative DNA primase/helicase
VKTKEHKDAGARIREKNRRERAQKASRPASLDPATLTDAGNAERFAEAHRDELLYCWPWKKWLVYDGRRWKPDDTGAVWEAARKLAKQMYRQALDLENAADREALAGHALATLKRKQRLEALIDLARSLLPVLPDDLNCYHDFLNVRNGWLPLQTEKEGRGCSGLLMPHLESNMTTALAPVEFDAEARCPTWVKFLDEIFAGDADLIDFVQKFLGYCLSGHYREELLVIFYGTGANGKTTLVNAVLQLLGPDYAIIAPPELLLAGAGRRHPTELADLFGKRLVVCLESDRGARLNEALVKQLTGRDRIRARRMREDFWEFEPTHKIILVTNDKPRVAGTDHGIWRRIRLVPFAVCIPDERQDKDLPRKLRDERPGILNWLLEGWRRYLDHGLTPPAAVEAATAEYRGQQDVVGRFLAEECVLGPDYRVRATPLFTAYKAWCKANGEKEGSRLEFGEAMNQQPEVRRTTSNGTWYVGVALRRPDGAGDPIPE